MLVVFGEVVGDAGLAAVHVPAAKVFGGDDFPRCSFDKRRAGEEDRSLLANDDRLVRHGRHIGSARGTAAHDAGNLRDTLRRQVSLIVEDAAEMFPVREDFVLVGQVGAAGIDQVDARQVVLKRDLLSAKVLLHRHWVVGAAFNGRVIGDDHDLPARNLSDARNHAGAGDILAIHAIRGELGDFQEG